jgi:hypothetical protein
VKQNAPDSEGKMTTFCLVLWGIIMFFGVLFWRRYPPNHEFRRVSLLMMVLATCFLPIMAILDYQGSEERQSSSAADAAAVEQLQTLQRSWRENRPARQP